MVLTTMIAMVGALANPSLPPLAARLAPVARTAHGVNELKAPSAVPRGTEKTFEEPLTEKQLALSLLENPDFVSELENAEGGEDMLRTLRTWCFTRPPMGWPAKSFAWTRTELTSEELLPRKQLAKNLLSNTDLVSELENAEGGEDILRTLWGWCFTEEELRNVPEALENAEAAEDWTKFLDVLDPLLGIVRNLGRRLESGTERTLKEALTRKHIKTLLSNPDFVSALKNAEGGEATLEKLLRWCGMIEPEFLRDFENVEGGDFAALENAEAADVLGTWDMLDALGITPFFPRPETVLG